MLRTVLLSLALLGGGLSAAAWLTHDFQVWTDEGARRLEVALRPVPVPAVTVDGTGIAPSTLPQLLATPGHVTIADFFYTRCKTVCLTLGSSFNQLQAALAQDNPGVQLLSISFDGGHDTPNILRHYARPLGADPAIWRFARVADPTEQAALLRATVAKHGVHVDARIHVHQAARFADGGLAGVELDLHVLHFRTENFVVDDVHGHGGCSWKVGKRVAGDEHPRRPQMGARGEGSRYAFTRGGRERGLVGLPGGRESLPHSATTRPSGATTSAANGCFPAFRLASASSKLRRSQYRS